MNPPDFERFQVSAQDHGVLFYYVGEFTAPMVSAAADTLKARLATEDASGPAKRKVFSTFVEMAQNILHYAAPSPGDGAQASPRGAIAVGRLAEGSTDGQGGFKSEVQHLPPCKVRRCQPPPRTITSSSLKTASPLRA